MKVVTKIGIGPMAAMRVWRAEVAGTGDSQAQPTVHDAGPWYVSAPWRNEAIASGLLMPKS